MKLSNKIRNVVLIAVFAIGISLGWLLRGPQSSKNPMLDHDITHSNEIWTCSMHPQIKQPESGLCPICGMELIPMEDSISDLGSDELELSEYAMALAGVQTMKVGNSKSSNLTTRLSGRITINEKASYAQTAHVEGRLEKLNVNFTGETVQPGQRLGSIYSPELLAAQKELLIAYQQKNLQPDLYRAVRNKLKLWKLTDTQINEIEWIGKPQEYIPIYAEVAGVVMEKMVSQGDYVMQGEVLFKISNLGRLWAEFDIYESQIEQIKEGDSLRIFAKALPSSEFQAKIIFIDPLLNAERRTGMVRAELDNRSGLLKPGMFVDALINSRVTKQAEITIPKSAILWTGTRSIVYVKTDKGKSIFEAREVQISGELTDEYLVSNGLEDGDEVVINGAFSVDAAAQLQGKESMMNSKKSMIKGKAEDHHISLNNLDKTTGQTLISGYLSLKEGLVDGRVDTSAKEAKSLTSFLPKNHQNEVLTNILKEIASSSDIEQQRILFVSLSEILINWVKKENSWVQDTLYIQFCPMANEDRGAYWLSHEEVIRNPYYGEKMLTCGNVEEVLTPAK